MNFKINRTLRKRSKTKCSYTDSGKNMNGKPFTVPHECTQIL